MKGCEQTTLSVQSNFSLKNLFHISTYNHNHHFYKYLNKRKLVLLMIVHKITSC